jgi:hypothetical protein
VAILEWVWAEDEVNEGDNSEVGIHPTLGTSSTREIADKKGLRALEKEVVR